MSSPIVEFYTNGGKDHRGRTLQSYFTWDDRTLEYTHDYIQWMFPLTEGSKFNPNAPILSEEDVNILSGPDGSWLVTSANFFWNFIIRGTEKGTPQYWVSPANHNHLRLTRMMKSLRLMGHHLLAEGFYYILLQIDKEAGGILSEAIPYWKEAGGPIIQTISSSPSNTESLVVNEN